MFKRKILWIALICLSCLLLCGCSDEAPQPELPANVVLSAGEFPADTQQLSIAASAEDFALLDGFTALQSVDFSGSELYEQIVSWAQAHPQVNVSYTVKLPDGQNIPHNASSLDLSGLDSANLDSTLSLLNYLPSVSSIKLPENIKPDVLTAFSAAYPQIKLEYSASVNGITISPEVTELDLSSANSAQVQELVFWLPMMPNVQQINFGSERSDLSWDDIYAVKTSCPQAKLSYSFTLYNKELTLDETFLDLNHIKIDDEGALVKKVTACMNSLEFLDMDSCSVSNEAMAEIRDSLPNTKVVWRLWFADKYSIRTDVEKILASNPDMGGELTPENTECLKYCTNVKYLDLGHNAWLGDISFVSYMPDLEVAILAMANWSDCSPLANCPKLEYAELQTSSLNDLRPLTQLKNLKHLNIAYCPALTDISPLYEMTQLERVWIGCLTPISPEQVAELQNRIPDCQINTTALDPTDGGWRYEVTEFGFVPVPRYELLRDQFEYQLANGAYSYYFNDPLYY